MRHLMILGLAAIIIIMPGRSAWASPVASCPTRGEVIDSFRGVGSMHDLWLIMSFGSIVGLSGAYWGVPAGVLVSLATGGASAISGLRTIKQIDTMIRDSLTEMSGRMHRDADEIYDQMRYGEEIIAGNWLMRVAGAMAGSIAGLVAPLGVGPLQGLRASVVVGSIGGVTIGGLWHRAAAWPFSDELPDLCRDSVNSTRI